MRWSTGLKCTKREKYMHYRTQTHTQTFNGLFSRTTGVGWYQKDKPFWILLKQEMTRWQWHRLNHMQIICTSLQTDNHTSTSSLHIFYRPDALPVAQPTASKHWRTNAMPTENIIRPMPIWNMDSWLVCLQLKSSVWLLGIHHVALWIQTAQYTKLGLGHRMQ